MKGISLKIRKKVEFPNPYGYKLPPEEDVRTLQKKYGFSDSYADFLLTQNGLVTDRYLDAWKKGKIHPDRNEEAFRNEYCAGLYGVMSGDNPMKEWLACLFLNSMEDFFLLPYFFPIGDDLGGNPYVEVLVGRYKGCIGQLDHERFYGYESLHKWFYGFDEEDAGEYSIETEEERINRIETDGLLFTIWAPSMKDFTENCIFCLEREDEEDDRFRYRVDCVHYPGYAEWDQALHQQFVDAHKEE